MEAKLAMGEEARRYNDGLASPKQDTVPEGSAVVSSTAGKLRPLSVPRKDESSRL